MVHFRRGVELYRERSLDAALVEMERAYELYPSYSLLRNLAQLQAERHEYVKALDLYERYLAEGGSEIGPERRRRVVKEFERLSLRVGALSVSTNVEGATLYIDAVPVATVPLRSPIIVTAGIHVVRLEKSGYSPTRQEVKIAGGETARVRLRLLAKAPLPPGLQHAPQKSADRRPVDVTHVPFWISASAAGVLAITATTFAVLAGRANGDLDAELEAFPADRTSVNAARSRTRALAATADGFLIASVIAAGTAVYFLLDPPAADRENPHRQAGLRLGLVGLEGSF